MRAFKSKTTIPLAAAIIILLVIVIAAGALVYIQYDSKMKYIAATEQSTAAKESYVMSVFDRIEANLATIREKEAMISKDFNTPDNYGDLGPEERIQHEIDYIEYLLEENNRMIASLNQDVKDKDARLNEYSNTVIDLKARINEYQVNVDKLLAEKAALQTYLDETTADRRMLKEQVDTLNNEIARTSQDLSDQIRMTIERENELNKAFYAIGVYKDLRDKEILQKEGGFLGINRVTTLTESPDPELFHEIDIRDVKQIPIYAKHWEIVTGQDPDSYELSYDNNQVNWINITNPEKFWNKTKYLVIVIRDKDSDELALTRDSK